MKLGIVGLPNVGKTPDERLDWLAEYYHPKKYSPATVDFVDIAGVSGGGKGNEVFQNIRQVDALVEVVRCFENDDVFLEKADAVRDAESFELELILADLEITERRLERAKKNAKGGDKKYKHECETCEALIAHLTEEKPARDFEFTEEDADMLADGGLLTIKPVIYVANLDEDGMSDPDGNANYTALKAYAVTGGVVGSIFVAMRMGVARGIFSNEAGLGSAPIAAAAAKTNEPVRQGLVCMTGTFIDTIIICTMTGLAIVVTGAWEPSLGLKGVDITIEAFRQGLGFLPHADVIGPLFLSVALAFFAFTTILGWDYYSEKCLEYLVGRKNKAALKVYRLLYVLVVFVGPYLTVSVVWGIADTFNGLMAFPNLVALVLLSPTVARLTRDYFRRLKAGEIKE